METGQVLHARFGDVCVLKFVGSIGFTSNWTFPLSKSLRTFLDKLFQDKDFDNIVIDLTEATGIDSTNLGLLAEIARFSMDEFGRKPTLIAQEGRVMKALTVTGFEALYTIFSMNAPIQGPLKPLPDSDGEHVDVPRMILDAHLMLSDMNEHNRRLFRSVVDALESDIARKEKEQANPPS